MMNFIRSIKKLQWRTLINLGWPIQIILYLGLFTSLSWARPPCVELVNFVTMNSYVQELKSAQAKIQARKELKISSIRIELAQSKAAILATIEKRRLDYVDEQIERERLTLNELTLMRNQVHEVQQLLVKLNKIDSSLKNANIREAIERLQEIRTSTGPWVHVAQDLNRTLSLVDQSIFKLSNLTVDSNKQIYDLVVGLKFQFLLMVRKSEARLKGLQDVRQIELHLAENQRVEDEPPQKAAL